MYAIGCPSDISQNPFRNCTVNEARNKDEETSVIQLLDNIFGVKHLYVRESYEHLYQQYITPVKILSQVIFGKPILPITPSTCSSVLIQVFPYYLCQLLLARFILLKRNKPILHLLNICVVC